MPAFRNNRLMIGLETAIRRDYGQLTTLSYLGISVIFGGLLAVFMVYLNSRLIGVFGMPSRLSFFFLLETPSVGTVFAAITLFRFTCQAEHNKAKQSHKILTITRKTLPYLRKGLSFESASEVVRIIHDEIDAVAVSITDRTTILGYRGVGEDH